MRNKESEDTDESSGEGLSATAPIAIAVPLSDDANDNDAPLATARPQSDEEAQDIASAARERGIAVVRHHCDEHLSQNPGSSYVTWIATLHPENAQVSIDPRFMVPGNPWLAVYEEAKDDLQKARGRKASSEVDGVTVSPAPSAPPLDDDRDGSGNGHDAGTIFGLLDFVVGGSLVIISVSYSFAFEIAASYCYLSYWLCSKIVDGCCPPTMFTWLPLSVAFAIGQIFQLLDISFLFVSIILIEIIAATNYIICTILACSHDRGRTMHQTTRKLSHLVRWAFRQKFANWDPPRMQFRPCLTSSGTD